MPGPTCQICGRPASLRDVTLAGGGATASALCRDHGEPAWRAALAEVEARIGLDRDAAFAALRQALGTAGPEPGA